MGDLISEKNRVDSNELRDTYAKESDTTVNGSDIKKIERFRQCLQDINASDACITELSQQMQCNEKPLLICRYFEVWMNAVAKESSAVKIIALFYVINDFIQNSVYKHPAVLEVSVPYLKQACACISKKRSASLDECQRVISIWRRRNIFNDGSVCLFLTKILHGNSSFEDLSVPHVPLRNLKDSSKARVALFALQRDGTESDGYVRPAPSEFGALAEHSAAGGFGQSVETILGDLEKIRKELVDKRYIFRKIESDGENLMLQLSSFCNHEQLSGFKRGEEVEGLKSSIEHNRARQKLLLDKEWKLRCSLHNVFESLGELAEDHIKQLCLLHVVSKKYVALLRKELNNRSTKG